MSTALCAVCERRMVVLNKGRRMFMIACPAGHIKLPVISTVPGARQFYESESQAVEEAERLYVLMSNSHKEARRRGRGER